MLTKQTKANYNDIQKYNIQHDVYTSSNYFNLFYVTNWLHDKAQKKNIQLTYDYISNFIDSKLFSCTQCGFVCNLFETRNSLNPPPVLANSLDTKSFTNTLSGQHHIKMRNVLYFRKM